MSTSLRASCASVVPQFANSGPVPPNVPAPKLSTGTLRPEAPKRRYSIESIAILLERIRCSLGFDAWGPNQLVDIDGVCHRFVAAIAGMQMISRVELCPQAKGMI